ncbi:MAG: NERD domain-containing protein [Chloroflexi bacterium]|nr:NERD domain-containing protein [Chloroflexota bacterium]
MTQPKDAGTPTRVSIDLTMSEAEARATLWQGRGPREPMGRMLDSKQLDSNDLAWAIGHAYNPQVRAAARTLLALWIGKPATEKETERFGPEVIIGSHYLEEQETDNLTQFAFYAGFGYGVVAIGGCAFGLPLIALFIISVISGQPNAVLALELVAVLVVFGGVALELYRRMRRNALAFRSFRAGRKGEEAALEILRAALDNRWTIFRSLHVPGHQSDCDLILVGPSGVWLLEVKAYRGTLRVDGRRWERQTKRGWRTLEENPSDQVARNATRLNDFLQRQGIKRWIDTAIVLAEPQPISNLEGSEIPIWLLPQLENKVAKLTTRNLPNDADLAKIVKILTDVAAKQLAKEEAEANK